MTTFSNEHIKTTLRHAGLVPLFTHENAEDAQQIVEAAYKGGMRVVEFTNRKQNALAVFKHLIAQRHRYPELMIGIGTVMDASTTQLFIDAGADFIIAPILKVEMAAVCKQHNKLWIPGCATLTEIVTAKENGAEVIKVFPGSVLGPGFVSAIMPVVPGLQLMITGGVEPTEKNLSAWFNAGAMCVGLGSQLFTREILDAKNWDALSAKVTEALQLIQQIKNDQSTKR